MEGVHMTAGSGNGTGGDASGDDGFVLTWDRILSVAPSNVREFLENPTGFILATVIGAMVMTWEAVLDYLGRFYQAVADSVFAAIAIPLGTVGRTVGDAVLSVWFEIGEMAASASASAGVFGPIVTAAFWSVGAVGLGIATWAILRLIATYVPIDAIPIIGGWVR